MDGASLRVCKRRVVVKDRFDSPVFEQFNMERIVRPNTKFHFGFIEKNEKRRHILELRVTAFLRPNSGAFVLINE